MYKNLHLGETGVVIGNGPSLNKTPLEELASLYATFGSNKIYRLPFTPTYYSLIDKEMMKTCLPLPFTFTPKAKFIRAECGLADNHPIYPIVLPGFSMDIENFVIMGGTVTYVLLQLAYYMGFETILLVGVDHFYPNTTPFTGFKITAGSKDPDHFLPKDGKPYFDTGKTFNAPELDGSTNAYKIAKEVYEKHDRKIINLTPESRLDVFDKDTWDNWL